MGPECVAERCIAFVFSGSMFLKLITTHFTNELLTAIWTILKAFVVQMTQIYIIDKIII